MIFNELKNSFNKGSVLSRLIYINLFLFVIIKVVGVVFFLFNVDNIHLNSFLALAANAKTLISRPWTPLTYMFTHTGFLHLFFNLLWLYFGGSIFLKYLSNKQLVSTYFLGGFFGGLFYVLSYNYFPAFKEAMISSSAMGASASVLAILIGIATVAPNYNVNLTFIGNVKLKYIAIIITVLDLILIPEGNAGGHIAHLGGAFYGFFFAQQLKKGKDISKWFDSLMIYIVSAFESKPRMKSVYKKPMTDDQWRANKAQKQNEINHILDKIAKSGYDSLTKQEKDILFRESNK
ncbi:MAG: rhomboid family intramembrane serine protease [Bacteroidota bacterium]|nr:rhomboid family intramembrane serine protease [Bacteroidota bacterium]